jgi:hypothetical protein
LGFLRVDAQDGLVSERIPKDRGIRGFFKTP